MVVGSCDRRTSLDAKNGIIHEVLTHDHLHHLLQCASQTLGQDLQQTSSCKCNHSLPKGWLYGGCIRSQYQDSPGSRTATVSKLQQLPNSHSIQRFHFLCVARRSHVGRLWVCRSSLIRSSSPVCNPGDKSRYTYSCLGYITTKDLTTLRIPKLQKRWSANS